MLREIERMLAGMEARLEVQFDVECDAILERLTSHEARIVALENARSPRFSGNVVAFPAMKPNA